MKDELALNFNENYNRPLFGILLIKKHINKYLQIARDEKKKTRN